MYGRGVRFFTGRVNACAVRPRVFEPLQSGRIKPELITSEVLEWAPAREALLEPSMKPVFVRDV